MPENKVQFNLKNVHYAKQVVEDGVVSFAAPVHVPGAVTLTMSPQGEVTKFYADGVVYYQASNNDGYSGDLEMAKYPDQMLKDIWGYEEGTVSKVLTENANAETAAFALLYQIDGDVDNELYVMYACTGTRPGVGSKTKSNTKEPQTQSSTITAVPMADGKVLARTTATTPADVKNSWFKTVFVEGAGA